MRVALINNEEIPLKTCRQCHKDMPLSVEYANCFICRAVWEYEATPKNHMSTTQTMQHIKAQLWSMVNLLDAIDNEDDTPCTPAPKLDMDSMPPPSPMKKSKKRKRCEIETDCQWPKFIKL